MMDSIDAEEWLIAQQKLGHFDWVCISQACLGAALLLRRCPVKRKHVLSKVFKAEGDIVAN